MAGTMAHADTKPAVKDIVIVHGALVDGLGWRAAVAGSMLPVSSSYVLTYPSQAQNCASTGSTYSSEGVGNCKSSKEHGGNLDRSASAGHSVSAARVGR